MSTARMLARTVLGGRMGSTWILGAMLLSTSSCYGVPKGRAAVDDVTVRGAKQVDSGPLMSKLATQESAKFFGVFQGFIYKPEVFDRAALQRDLARAERYYRARGFYDARVRAGRVTHSGDDHVRVEVVVDEGPPTKNAPVRVMGLESVPLKIAQAVVFAARDELKQGEPFDEDQYQEAEHRVTYALTSRGYAYATATREVYVDIVRHVAETVITVTPGEPAKFGTVTIVGLDPDASGPRPQEIPEPPLRRAIKIAEGDPYSSHAVGSAIQALLDLEVFAAVDIVPDLSHPETHVVPLTVRVEPSKLRQVRLGGGLELDQIKTELHVITGWEDHNFLGGLRDFSVDFKPGVVLFPVRIDNFIAPTDYFPEERLRLQLKQPAFIEGRTTGFVRPEFNVFPLLVQTSPSPDDPVVGYGEFRGSTGVDRNFFDDHVYVRLSLDAQVETPFPYKGPLDTDLGTVTITYPELLTQLDLRDDHNHPHSGIFIANDLQVAGGPFAGSVRDVKVQPEVRGYIPIAPGITLASRASIAFLFPYNYGDYVENHLGDLTPSATRRERVRDIETVFFRGLYSGGATSNRGFPIRGIAPHGVVPFLNPQSASAQVAHSCAPRPNGTLPPDADCSIPIGGFSLWEFSTELRFHIDGPVSAAIFCDFGDVSPHTADIRLDHLHMSCGAGGRYDTPVGPIRLDVGYRIEPLQVLGYANDYAANAADRTEGIQPRILAVPIAIAFGIGEAY